MTYQEFIEMSNIKTAMGMMGEWCARLAWNHQQAKIDAMKKQLEDIQRKLNSIKEDEIRPRNSEYDFGWQDCAATVLDDIKELLK